MSTVVRRIAFAGVNLLLIWHVFAIAISPASMPPASPFLADASSVARPYNLALFLNHGYHYFAPNPGASSLLEFSAPSSNDIPQVVRIPDPEGYFPRLRYHRFFMLSENVWAFGEEPQKEFIEAYARHFGRQLNSPKVDVTSVSHEPAPMGRIAAGGDLHHPTSYFRESVASFEFAEDGSTLLNTFDLPPSTEAEEVARLPEAGAEEHTVLKPILLEEDVP